MVKKATELTKESKNDYIKLALKAENALTGATFTEIDLIVNAVNLSANQTADNRVKAVEEPIAQDR